MSEMPVTVLPSAHHRLPRRDDGGAWFAFGEFVVNVRARTLERAGQPIAIGDRAFDLLIVLLRAQGEIVSKAGIVKYVWPSTFVEEANLRVQVALLRKALGDAGARVKCVIGRGYLFVGDPDAGDRSLAAARFDFDAGLPLFARNA
ncbi:MAG: winged helix-turn-helix domain-containing protein [Sphingomonas sp.]|uniref:winged helix-turn-helix domain-containing protein n=1 Tax=Sphingomonas sp. TaxID=28214 RepID=UPI002274D549|nr:winged helix-turn-helix domain-containing protein [Sphingomonas sp.]MCX8478018.1 winged helix-turn-helix domain-containing protein [Sphingomonas sp.]